MGTQPTASITWADALGWRMERHLLDPVGSDSAADVVRRLDAVLSMDESLAELAVRTRRTASRPGELAQALADGEVIIAFAFRGAMHYLSPEEGGVYLALRAAPVTGKKGQARATQVMRGEMLAVPTDRVLRVHNPSLTGRGSAPGTSGRTVDNQVGCGRRT